MDEIVFVEIDGHSPDELEGAPVEHSPIGDLGRHLVHQTRESVHNRCDELAAQRHARELARLSAKPQPHAGVGVDRPRRTGHVEEVIVTLAAPPPVIRRAALCDELHDTDVARLHIDRASRTVSRREVRWKARLRTGLFRHRGATLRFYTSPSTNVSVLSLVPVHPHKVYTGAFIRAGLRALGEMTAQLDAHASAGAAGDQSSLNAG